MKTTYLLAFLIVCFSCERKQKSGASVVEATISSSKTSQVSLVVLGTVQDAGSPHIACKKDCCIDLFKNPDNNRKVVSLGLVDTKNHSKYLFEATPDIARQMKMLKEYGTLKSTETPDGIFITHAHIGHYTGLMYLGKEAMNAKNVPVYAMPVMRSFLETNGPWGQLISNQNILLKELAHESTVPLQTNIQVVPFTVPHRDEYSETVGYTIIGPHKKALFIPDIDKWEKWDKDIIDAIRSVDYAFLDATFYDEKEINNRDISEIPHPFIIESMAKFKELPSHEKNKVVFIHFNHTNPVLNPNSNESKQVLKNGFRIARINDVFEL